jgi:uncharacterized protein (TIGR01244 family)
MANGITQFAASGPQLLHFGSRRACLPARKSLWHSNCVVIHGRAGTDPLLLGRTEKNAMFRKISDRVFASPQIGLAEVAQAAAQGITLIVNNRPEGESDDQVPGAEIEAAAKAAGLGYVAIPVTHAGFSEGQVKAMSEALAQAGGPVLAYCRSGTRSTLLWALAEASRGADPDAIAAQAAQAGYDIGPVRALVDMLAAGKR